MVEVLWVQIPPRCGDIAACVFAYLPSVEKVPVFVKASTAVRIERTKLAMAVGPQTQGDCGKAPETAHYIKLERNRYYVN
jgi:hypothetical protein